MTEDEARAAAARRAAHNYALACAAADPRPEAPPEPTREDLLAEIAALRERLDEAESERARERDGELHAALAEVARLRAEIADPVAADERPTALRWPVSPAVMRQIEEAGFEPGSMNPIAWMMGEIARLRARAALVPGVEAEWTMQWGRPTRSYVLGCDTNHTAMWIWRGSRDWMPMDVYGWAVFGPGAGSSLAHGDAPSMDAAKAAAEEAARRLGVLRG
jgi:hypothetical protein